jgi:hypothetical protein
VNFRGRQRPSQRVVRRAEDQRTDVAARFAAHEGGVERVLAEEKVLLEVRAMGPKGLYGGVAANALDEDAGDCAEVWVKA